MDAGNLDNPKRTTCVSCAEPSPLEMGEQRPSLQRIGVPLDGLSRAGDAVPLAAKLQKLRGVQQAIVNPITERAVVTFHPRHVGAEKLIYFLEDEGYEVGRSIARWHLRIPGLKCASCIRRIEQSVDNVRGVHRAAVNLATEDLTIEYTPRSTDLCEVRAAVESQGFDIGPSPAGADVESRDTPDGAYPAVAEQSYGSKLRRSVG